MARFAIRHGGCVGGCEGGPTHSAHCPEWQPPVSGQACPACVAMRDALKYLRATARKSLDSSQSGKTIWAGIVFDKANGALALPCSCQPAKQDDLAQKLRDEREHIERQNRDIYWLEVEIAKLEKELEEVNKTVTLQDELMVSAERRGVEKATEEYRQKLAAAKQEWISLDLGQGGRLPTAEDGFKSTPDQYISLVLVRFEATGFIQATDWRQAIERDDLSHWTHFVPPRFSPKPEPESDTLWRDLKPGEQPQGGDRHMMHSGRGDNGPLQWEQFNPVFNYDPDILWQRPIKAQAALASRSGPEKG